MARLWRSVIIVGACFAAVVAMRIYLNKQVEIAKSTAESLDDSGSISTQ